MGEDQARVSEDRTSIHLRIEGVVQSVGYRAFVVDIARQLHVDGWVRNCYDGTVEALVSGHTTEVESFVAQCMRGPAFAHVENIDLQVAEPPEHHGFKRLPTH